MSTLETQAAPAVELLLESDEDQLFEELGLRVNAIRETPALAGEFSPDIVADTTDMGALDTMRELGQRIFNRWEREAFGLFCGTAADDQGDRTALAEAFGLGATAVAALVAASLVSAFGLAPAIAAVIAAVIVKRFLRPVLEEFCTVWKTRLEASDPLDAGGSAAR
jgi:hypothetical protein